MESAQVYILISVIALLVIFLFFVITRKNKDYQKITPLTGLVFILIILAIVFNNRFYSYSMIGIGIILAVTDIFLKKRGKKK